MTKASNKPESKKSKKTDEKSNKKIDEKSKEPTTVPKKTERGRAPPPLEWAQHGRDTWLAEDPAGGWECARITMRTQMWLKGKDADPCYYVYRGTDGGNTVYLGSDSTLEAAKHRARYKEKSARVLQEETSGGLPAFLALTSDERKKTRDTNPLAPQVRKSWGVGNPERPQTPEMAQAASARRSMVEERRAAKTRSRSEIRGGDVIRVLVDGNPRKSGTGAHTRFELLRAHNGKTADEYRAAGGNEETLENAISAGRAKMESSDE